MRSTGQLVAEAWERAITLGEYGMDPLTVGWWRGQAHVYLWNWRTGSMQWTPFQTTRAETPPQPRRDCWMWERLAQ